MAAAAKKSKVTADTDIARKIWLAGVGAYGRVFAETQGAVEKLAGSASETFEHLVANGELVEDTVRARIAQSGAGERVASLVGSVARQVRDMRAGQRAAIGKARKNIDEMLAPFNVAQLAKSVKKLSAQVEALSAEVTQLKGAKAKAKK